MVSMKLSKISRAAILTGVSAAACTAFAATQAQASGFYLQDHSVSAMGAAYSGASTQANDASIVYYNPGAITDLDHLTVTAEAIGITAQDKLSNNGSTLLGGPVTGPDGKNPLITSLVPSGYIAAPVWDNKLWAGLAITTPFGLSEDYKDNWFGRFNAVKSDLRTYDVQPTLAYKVSNWFSIGAGLDFQHATAELTQAFPVGGGGTSRLNGDDNAWGWTAGALVKPLPGTKISFDYRSQVNYNLNGAVDAPGAGLNDVPAHAKLDLPAQATIGISQDIDPKWTVMSQLTWMGWSNFNNITAILDGSGTVAEASTENYKNSYSFAAGTAYKWSPQWTFRAGYQFDQTPTQGSNRDTRVPDANRNWLTLGTTYNWSKNLSFDLAAAYIRVNNSNISVPVNVSGVGTVGEVNASQHDGNIEILGLGASYKF